MACCKMCPFYLLLSAARLLYYLLCNGLSLASSRAVQTEYRGHLTLLSRAYPLTDGKILHIKFYSYRLGSSARLDSFPAGEATTTTD